MISQKELKELLHYNQDTGDFFWKKTRTGASNIGAAGCRTDAGYIKICINNEPYYAHRLAYLYINGYMPENHIDHIDRVKSNNSISNLREVSRIYNMRNTGNMSNNKSGVKGVHFCKQRGKWIASIKNTDKKKNIGGFDDLVEAVANRLAVEQCLDWGDCDATSPAYLFMKKYLSSH